jgi:hypothetical protein
MGTRKPSEEPARSAPDGPIDETDDHTTRRERRRRRAREAGLQSLVRTLANRSASEPDA